MEGHADQPAVPVERIKVFGVGSVKFMYRCSLSDGVDGHGDTSRHAMLDEVYA